MEEQDNKVYIAKIPISRIARPTHGYMIATIAAGLVVGVWYSIGNLLSLVGWVLASVATALYFVLEQGAVKYYNQNLYLKTTLELIDLQREGTLDDEDGLNVHKGEDDANDKSSTDSTE